MSKNIAAFEIYSTRLSVETAIENLRSAGFRGTNIKALCPGNQEEKIRQAP